jgi:hypothetical protein
VRGGFNCGDDNARRWVDGDENVERDRERRNEG